MDERRATESQEVREVEKNRTTKDRVMEELSAAQQALMRSYQIAVKATPLAQDLPVFIEIQRLEKSVAANMQAVARLRGL